MGSASPKPSGGQAQLPSLHCRKAFNATSQETAGNDEADVPLKQERESERERETKKETDSGTWFEREPAHSETDSQGLFDRQSVTETETEGEQKDSTATPSNR